MSNGNSAAEIGESLPTKEATPSELLEAIALNLQKLIDAPEKMQLAERTLRIASTFDPQLTPAHERADQLKVVREQLQRVLESVSEYLPVAIPTRELGGMAINHTELQNNL